VTRRNKLIILATYLLALAIVLPLYRLKRSSADKRLQAEISASKQEIAKIKASSQEMEKLRRMFPLEAHTALFVEELYTAALQSKLAAHEVSTESSAQRSPARKTTQPEDLIIFNFKVTVEGSYRSIAEYIRKIQNIERFKRITDIRLSPGKLGVAGTISLELISLKGQNAR
jgi:Tfp pilus assembly protein PilO